MEILQKIFLGKKDLPIDFSALDEKALKKISSNSEGFVGADFERLVDRAIHHSSMRFLGEISQDTQTLDDRVPIVTSEDFIEALDGFVPLSLKDVQLHKSEVSWDTIGGKDIYISLERIRRCKKNSSGDIRMAN